MPAEPIASAASARPHDAPPLRWPAYVHASAACHVGAGVAALAFPAQWPWALGAIAANHALLTGAGLWPRSQWLGSNWTRLPAAARARGEVAITLDDGPDPEVTPAALDLLDAHAAKATFFCIGQTAALHPALCREIVRRGHSVQNHSDSHPHRFSMFGPRRLAREIDAAQSRLADITGERPRFFRAPAGLRNPFLPLVLQRLGLQYVSWTRRGFDTVRHDPVQVLERLARGLAAGDILLAHDGHSARTAAGQPVLLDVLPALLGRIAAAKLRPLTLPAAVDGVAGSATA